MTLDKVTSERAIVLSKCCQVSRLFNNSQIVDYRKRCATFKILKLLRYKDIKI